MAKPIEPTPTLEGIDAEELLRELNNPIYSREKADFLRKCYDSYKRTKKLNSPS